MYTIHGIHVMIKDNFSTKLKVSKYLDYQLTIFKQISYFHNFVVLRRSKFSIDQKGTNSKMIMEY